MERETWGVGEGDPSLIPLLYFTYCYKAQESFPGLYSTQKYNTASRKSRRMQGQQHLSQGSLVTAAGWLGPNWNFHCCLWKQHWTAGALLGVPRLWKATQILQESPHQQVYGGPKYDAFVLDSNANSEPSFPPFPFFPHTCFLGWNDGRALQRNSRITYIFKRRLQKETPA